MPASQPVLQGSRSCVFPICASKSELVWVRPHTRHDRASPVSPCALRVAKRRYSSERPYLHQGRRTTTAHTLECGRRSRGSADTPFAGTRQKVTPMPACSELHRRLNAGVPALDWIGKEYTRPPASTFALSVAVRWLLVVGLRVPSMFLGTQG